MSSKKEGSIHVRWLEILQFPLLHMEAFTKVRKIAAFHGEGL